MDSIEPLIVANQIELTDEHDKLRIRLSGVPSERPSIVIFGEDRAKLELALSADGAEIALEREDGSRSISIKGNLEGGEFIICDSDGRPAFAIRVNDAERSLEIHFKNGSVWRRDACGGGDDSCWHSPTSGRPD